MPYIGYQNAPHCRSDIQIMVTVISYLATFSHVIKNSKIPAKKKPLLIEDFSYI